MIVMLPTIMHTGTILMIEEVFKDYQHIGIAQKPDGNSIMHCHTINHFFYDIAGCMDEYPVVVPMRHPARVLESFKRRGVNDRIYREQFGCMYDLTKNRNVSYVHIDQPEIRDADLGSVNDKLGTSLNTEWPVINTVGKTNELKLTEDMISEVPQWIMTYYMSTLN